LQPAAIASPTSPTASPTFVKVAEESAGAVYEIPAMVETRESESCAEVIAEIALHLRSGNSENADILSWLKHGEVVRVISKGDSNWWLIEREGVIGYARSIYLKESECE